MSKRSPNPRLNAALIRCGAAGAWLFAAAGTVAHADLQAPKSSGKVPPLPSANAPAASAKAPATKSTAVASNTSASRSTTAAVTPSAPAAASSSAANLPRVVIPTSNRPTAPVRPVQPGAGILYPWRQNITATVFWIGEAPSQNNPTPNYKS
ncbi:MAG: hypothetical protein JWO82_921, partial [Akkermansiaceae bacterium]|nr:hypothetical protein [Akkermansiaceae bacterium]